MENSLNQSKYTGGLLGLLGVEIVGALITLITFGIAAPWAVCMKENWVVEHTILDGKRLTFDGTGGQLFGKYIVWLMLTVITFGIYALWLPIKMQQWVTEHTHIV
ncbi:MAG: DUF898 family protein [Clostridia bacterium]|nr:DUF898 family protein [Clostridia bacterium]